jgi:hypothetical protein
MNKKIKEIIHELEHHAPFTFFATAIAILFGLTLYKTSLPEIFFEISHQIHVIASSIVTAGIFYKYKKNFCYAIFVGVFGAILIGSLSDIIFPYLGAFFFQLEPHFHLPILEEPTIILGAAIIGSILGILTGYTKFPHFLHVGISVFASLFYLLAFSNNPNPLFLVLSFIIIFISVIIPCCLSDIIFPFLFLGTKIKRCKCKD